MRADAIKIILQLERRSRQGDQSSKSSKDNTWVWRGWGGEWVVGGEGEWVVGREGELGKERVWDRQGGGCRMGRDH